MRIIMFLGLIFQQVLTTYKTAFFCMHVEWYLHYVADDQDTSISSYYCYMGQIMGL